MPIPSKVPRDSQPASFYIHVSPSRALLEPARDGRAAQSRPRRPITRRAPQESPLARATIRRMEMKVHRATRLLLASAALAVTALAVPAAVRAQAFGLNEIGSCAVGRAFANTASPCKDASAIYWNPAATTALSGWSISGGVAAIKINGAF